MSETTETESLSVENEIKRAATAFSSIILTGPRRSGKTTLLRHCFPNAEYFLLEEIDVIARPSTRDIWFRSYIQTYLERDVRSVLAIKDLATFRRFLALLATRVGQTLSKTAMAAPLGVSIPTITQWLGVLEVPAQVIIVPPFLGPLFEGLVASEIVKHQIHHGKSRAIYRFRDRQGLEVDFIVPQGEKRLALFEAKSTKTPVSNHAKPLRQLLRVLNDYQTHTDVVHQPAKGEL